MARTRARRYRAIEEDDLSPEQLRELLKNPAARDARSAADIGRLTLFVGMKLQGRRRVSEREPGTFNFGLPTEVPPEHVTKLGRALKGRQPVFGKFNKKAAIDEPTREVLNKYVHGVTKKNKRVPTDPADTQERQVIHNDKRRQVERVRDGFQRATFEKFKQAQLFRASLNLARKQIAAGLEIDPLAATWAAQAVFDFGASLDEGSVGKEVLREIHDEGMGVAIKHVGEAAFDDPAVLGQNTELLRLVQLEQAAREGFWQERYELSTRVFIRDRRTKDDIAMGGEVNTEVARMQALTAEITSHVPIT